MIKITQTDYIDFISRSGISKLSKVKSIHNRADYHPSHDFYKPLRDEIVETIKNNKNKKSLYEFLSDLSGSPRYSRYEHLIDGYSKFVGRKQIEWFEPPSATWNYKNLSIKMNPELGLIFNGTKYIVKMYFKDTPLEKGDREILLWMMERTLCSGIYSGYKCGLLDIERSKLHCTKDPRPSIEALVEGEAESFIKIWESFERKSA
jgi:hypothetical protein